MVNITERLNITVQDDFIDRLTRDIQIRNPHVRVAIYRLAEFAHAYNVVIDFPIVGEIRRDIDRRIEYKYKDYYGSQMKDIIDGVKSLLAEKETIRQCTELFCGIRIP